MTCSSPLKAFNRKEDIVMVKLAVIDLGSNSIRMSIFEINSDKTFRQVGNYRKMVKLSEGMNEDMNLQPEAQLRTVNAFVEFRKIMQKEDVTVVKCVATAAVRKAKNGSEFVETVKNVTDIDIEVIDGETEAVFDCLAISRTLGIDRAIVCDIGGGSTEFIAIVDGAMMKPAISKPMGSRSITEMFLSMGEDEVSLGEAKSYVEKHVEELPWLDEMQGAPIVGIGGTLRAFAKYHMCDESANAIERHEISSEDADALFEKIANADCEERCSMPGIGKERGDIIFGGLLPFMELKNLIDSPSLIVADVGVREGILYDFLESIE